MLKDRPQAFRQLHKLYSFDFESDFIYYEHTGNFTVNSLLKNAGNEAGAQLNTADYEMVLLVKPFLKWGKKNTNTWYLVDIKENNKPSVDVGNIYRKSGIYDSLDCFFTLQDFNNKRKDKKVKAVLIAQKRELLKPEKVKYIDYGERYSVTDVRMASYKGGKFISSASIKDGNGKKTVLYRYGRDIETVDDLIDKSGYIINERRKDLKRRAEALRAERKKNEFLAADLSKYLYDADKQMNDIKSVISGYMLKAQTSGDIAKINFYKLETVFNLYERLTAGIQGKTFASINSVERIYNDMCEDIGSIKNALNQ